MGRALSQTLRTSDTTSARRLTSLRVQDALRMLRPVRVFRVVRLFRRSARLHGPLLAILSPSISPSLSLTLPDARPRDATQGQRASLGST